MALRKVLKSKTGSCQGKHRARLVSRGLQQANDPPHIRVRFSILRLTKSRYYSVPVVERTLDILEVLHGSDCPLKTNEISSLAKVSRSTTYRILRTLVQRGYVFQNLDGEFSVKQPNFQRIVPIRQEDQPNDSMPTEPESDLSTDQLVDMLLGLLECLRSGSSGSFLVHKMRLTRSTNSGRSK